MAQVWGVRQHQRIKLMTAQDQKLCQRCHERPATHHICNANTGKSKHLCEPCYQETASPEELARSNHVREVVRNGKCRYCGAPAAGGSVGSSIPGVMDERPNLWCEPCRRDLVEFLKMPENAIAVVKWPFHDEAAQERISKQTAERERRQEEFMRRKVSERRSNGDA